MPTYEYRCTQCEAPLEVVQSIHDPALTECPECGGLLRKVFGNVGVVFKGSGFYRTDSRGKKAATAPKTEKADAASTSPKDGGSGGSSPSKEAGSASSGSGAADSSSSGSSSGSGSSGATTSTAAGAK